MGDAAAAHVAVRVLLGAAVIAAMSLVATSRRVRSLHRRPAVAALLGGSAPGLAAGVVLGPFGLRLLAAEEVLALRPVVAACLGWIGVIVGMQLRREVLAAVPRFLWKWAIVDAAICGGIALAVSMAIFSTWFVPESRSAAAMIVPVALVACAAIGWSPETRSIRTLAIRRGGASAPHAPESAPIEGAAQLAILVQAGSGLLSAAAVVALGIATQFVDTVGAAPVLVPLRGVLDFGLGAVVAVVLGIGAGVLLHLAGRARGSALVVLLGVTLVSVGVAVDLGYSALLTTVLTGAVVANLPFRPLRRFEDAMLRAEQPVALACGLLTGLLLDPRLGAWGVLLACALVALRLIAKPIIADRSLSWTTHRASTDPVRRTVRATSIRQAPIALVLGLAVVVIEESPLTRTLLAVIAIVGVASNLAAFAATRRGAWAVARESHARGAPT